MTQLRRFIANHRIRGLVLLTIASVLFLLWEEGIRHAIKLGLLLFPALLLAGARCRVFGLLEAEGS